MVIFLSAALIIVRSVPEIVIAEVKENFTFDSNDKKNEKVIQFGDLTALGITFEIIDIMIFSWFLVEYFIRLFFSPNIKKTLLSITNFIDISVFLLFIVYLTLKYNTVYYNLSILMRTIRIIVLLKVTRYSDGLKIFGKTIRKTYSEIFVLLIFLGVAATFFGTIVFYIEDFEMNEHELKITTLQESFW